MTSFAQITTMGVGGPIEKFVEPTTRVALIEAVEDADNRGVPLCVIGGGSNILASDNAFQGVVVRDARRNITVPDEAAPVENGDKTVHVNAEAGCNWDDFVEFCVELGLAGVEGLSGIPGTVGASVVQNIGAYGQDASTSIESVEVWDRAEKKTKDLTNADLHFGYRSSALKTSMYLAPAVPSSDFFPTPRYVVLSVTFALQHAAEGTVAYAQLAHALGVELGARMPVRDIRNAVLRIRAQKGMLEDATRYLLPEMAGTKRPAQIDIAVKAQRDNIAHTDADGADGASVMHEEAMNGAENYDYNRHSCGSFFMNPVITQAQAEKLPPEAPRYAAVLPDGSKGVKTSAAWLIDHAGFHKGYRINDHARAGLSTLHTLALTNRGGATSGDIIALARTIRDAVEVHYGIRLVPEPVLIGLSID